MTVKSIISKTTGPIITSVIKPGILKRFYFLTDQNGVFITDENGLFIILRS